jgi:hypothetical protein
MNQEADAEHDDTHSRRKRRFVWEFSFSLTCAILVVGVIAFLRYQVSETTLVTSGLYSVVAWIAGNQASHIHFLRIARADIHPFVVISMAISLWLCPLFLIWYVYEAGFKPAIVLLCIALALRLPLIALERLVLQGSEWRIRRAPLSAFWRKGHDASRSSACDPTYCLALPPFYPKLP